MCGRLSLLAFLQCRAQVGHLNIFESRSLFPTAHAPVWITCLARVHLRCPDFGTTTPSVWQALAPLAHVCLDSLGPSQLRERSGIQHVFNMYSTCIQHVFNNCYGRDFRCCKEVISRQVHLPSRHLPWAAKSSACCTRFLLVVKCCELASPCIILHHLASKTIALHNIEPGFKLWAVPVGYFLETQTRNQGCIDLVFVLHVVLASWFAMLSFLTQILHAVILLLVFRCV